MRVGNTADEDRLDMQRLAEGHDAALNSLMDRHGEWLLRFLLRELQNETEAVDLTEETFVRVYQNSARFDLERKFTTWLCAIAMNLVRDRRRWRSRHPEISMDAPAADSDGDWPGRLPDRRPTPGENLERTERAEAVRHALAELPDDLRTPLILGEYEGMSHGEIGEVLNCSAKAVEMRLYRGRQQLRKQLAGLYSPA